MFNRLATQVDKSSEPKLPHPGPPPDSEGVQKPPVPGTVYMPYAEKPVLSEPPYRPYREKPAQDEHPYEPYKDI